MLARESPVQHALGVWGVLAGSGPTFRGPSWTLEGGADGSRGPKEALSRAAGRLEGMGELGRGGPCDPWSQRFAPHPGVPVKGKGSGPILCPPHGMP